MRIVFVVPWYGDAGLGAERQCREFATRLAGRGHEVEVATSCLGRRGGDLEPSAFSPGTTVEEDVTVHRFASRAPRDDRFYVPLRRRVLDADGPVAYVVERDWMRMRGPDLPELAAWLQARSALVDVVAFFAYDRATSYDGLRCLTGLVPTVLHPLAAESRMFDRGIFDHLFRVADAFAWNTEEEQRAVGDRFDVRRPSMMIGSGIDPGGPDVGPGDVASFRARFGIGPAPFLLGVAPAGTDHARALAEMFAARGGPAREDVVLVITGRGSPDLGPGVVGTGRPDRSTLSAAIAGCRALVVPSYDEHAVPVLLDAWSRGRPALVDGRDRRLLTLVRDTGGGLAYTGFAEFDAAIDILLATPEVGAALGDSGRRHADTRHRWDDVLARYESMLEDVSIQWRSSTSSGRRSAGRGPVEPGKPARRT